MKLMRIGRLQDGSTRTMIFGVPYLIHYPGLGAQRQEVRAHGQ